MTGRKLVLALTSAVMMSAGYISFSTAGNSNEVTVATGEDLYRINCAGCHRTDLSGNPPHYPSLVDIKSNLPRNQLLEIIEDGKNQMPSFSHLSEGERDAIVAFLFHEKTASVELPASDMGKNIFKSNCSSCHRSSANDPPPPRTYGCMEPAPLAGATKRFTKQEFFNILEKGVCYMPSFSHLADTEREALYAHIKSLEGKGEPARPTMGEMCPMIMNLRRAEK